jgi:hypothetical protein
VTGTKRWPPPIGDRDAPATDLTPGSAPIASISSRFSAGKGPAELLAKGAALVPERGVEVRP